MVLHMVAGALSQLALQKICYLHVHALHRLLLPVRRKLSWRHTWFDWPPKCLTCLTMIPLYFRFILTSRMVGQWWYDQAEYSIRYTSFDEAVDLVRHRWADFRQWTLSVLLVVMLHVSMGLKMISFLILLHTSTAQCTYSMILVLS